MVDLHEYCEFGEERVYVLLAISRKAENAQITHNSEVVFREVIKNENDIDRKLQRIRAQAETYTPDEGGDLRFRLCLTANARNVVDAYYNFSNRMEGWARDMYYGDEAVLPKLKKVDRHWISELQRPENRDEKLFLHDIDDATEEEFAEFFATVPATVRGMTKTPNGYHIVTEPFNYTEWRHPVPFELKTDGLVHVDVIE